MNPLSRRQNVELREASDDAVDVLCDGSGIRRWSSQLGDPLSRIGARPLSGQ